jgi:hypothetical protein
MKIAKDAHPRFFIEPPTNRRQEKGSPLRETYGAVRLCGKVS